MTPNEYQQAAYVTANPENGRTLKEVPDFCNTERDYGDLLYGCIGLAGETGEFCDLVKKAVFHKKKEENFLEHAKKEAGDVAWYLALVCHSLGIDLEDVFVTNIKKLSARYDGGGFDYDHANNKKEGDI